MTGLHNVLLHNKNGQTAVGIHFGLLVFSPDIKVHVVSCPEISLNAFKHRRFSWKYDWGFILNFPGLEIIIVGK